MLGAILAAGSLLLNVGSAVANHQSKQKQKGKVGEAAREGLAAQTEMLAIRQQEEALAVSQQVHQLARHTTYGRGALAANAAAANVEGATVNALEADLFRADFEGRDILARNLASSERQLNHSRQAARADALNMINGVQGPSNLGTALDIGSSLVAFGYDWLNIKPPEGGKTVGGKV